MNALCKPKSPVPEKWFRGEIATGIQRLYALSLQSTPAADTIQSTAQVWIETLWEHKEMWIEADAQRIQKTFQTLTLECERWPTPKDFIKFLPPREQEFIKFNVDDDYPMDKAIENSRCLRLALQLSINNYIDTARVAKFLRCSTDDVARFAQENGIIPEKIHNRFLPSMCLSYWKMDWFLDVKKKIELERMANEQQHNESVGV